MLISHTFTDRSDAGTQSPTLRKETKPRNKDSSKKVISLSWPSLNVITNSFALIRSKKEQNLRSIKCQNLTKGLQFYQECFITTRRFYQNNVWWYSMECVFKIRMNNIKHINMYNYVVICKFNGIIEAQFIRKINTLTYLNSHLSRRCLDMFTDRRTRRLEEVNDIFNNMICLEETRQKPNSLFHFPAVQVLRDVYSSSVSNSGGSPVKLSGENLYFCKLFFICESIMTEQIN